jgi:CTP:molybdopterin cytidylyltransferase MocA
MKLREKIVPIILAAGSSRHLPFPKPLAVFGGKTALAIAVENCEGLEIPLVVLGCDAKRVRPAVPDKARVILNPAWRQGQLSSLLKALEHVPAKAAFLIYPVDHPLLRKNTIRQLVRAFRARKSPQHIAVPSHKRVDGHPVIISAALRKEFLQTKTAREVVYRDPKRIRVLDAHTDAILDDFDDHRSYQHCRRKFLSRREP